MLQLDKLLDIAFKHCLALTSCHYILYVEHIKINPPKAAYT